VTVGAIGAILIAQVPVMLWFSRSVDLQYPFAGVVGAWCVGATVWMLYTMAHLLAPIADIRSHPQRESWRPIQMINVYVYLATRRSGTRIIYGVLGFVVALYGILIFLLLNQLFLILPITVGLLASVLMIPHRETFRPNDETVAHFEP
jgi:hypothetical protein